MDQSLDSGFSGAQRDSCGGCYMDGTKGLVPGLHIETQQSASVSLFQRAAGISTPSGSCRDIDKIGALQKSLRTAAMASLKEGWRF
jgi:hypothetical protein